MSFTRTNSGISNQAMFYGAEMIVYTEGGRNSYSIEEVESGSFNAKSIDIKFWSGIFRSNNFNKKIKFKALGSKTAAKSLCDKVISGEVINTIVTRDRDFDQFYGEIIDSPYILYTKGYSWENDVFVKEVTTSQIESMFLEQELSDEIIEIIENAYSDYKLVGKRLLKLELLFRDNNKTFLTNINGERIFNNKKPHRLDRKKLLQLIEQSKPPLNKPVSFREDLDEICPLLFNYGKFLSCLSHSLINYLCKKYENYRALPKQLIDVSMISMYFSDQNLTPDPYYSELINRLKAA